MVISTGILNIIVQAPSSLALIYTALQCKKYWCPGQAAAR